MSFTYAQLKTAIQDYSDYSETSFVNNLDNFIKTAEERILKTVQLPVFRKNVTGTATSSNTYLATPSDFLSPYSLALIDSSNNYNYLLLKHVSFIRDYTPNASTTGEPLYYGLFDDNTFILGPTPNSNYTFELHYYYRPSSLTAGLDNGVTWLSDNAPNAILYGALVEAAVYMKQDPNTIGLYESKFQEALVLLKSLGEFKNMRDESRNDSIKLTPPVNQSNV
tara:strand:+ start:672 stop:1340 length:669 start_codon:yes stop_codon:yes gene_type:complete